MLRSTHPFTNARVIVLYNSTQLLDMPTRIRVRVTLFESGVERQVLKYAVSLTRNRKAQNALSIQGIAFAWPLRLTWM